MTKKHKIIALTFISNFIHSIFTCYNELPQQIKEDKAALIATIRKNYAAIRGIPMERLNKELIEAYLKGYVNECAKKERYVYSNSVYLGNPLAFIPEVIRNKELMMHVVEFDGALLQFASPELQADLDVVL